MDKTSLSFSFSFFLLFESKKWYEHMDKKSLSLSPESRAIDLEFCLKGITLLLEACDGRPTPIHLNAQHLQLKK